VPLHDLLERRVAQPAEAIADPFGAVGTLAIFRPVAEYALADSPYQRVLVVLGAGASSDNGRPPSQWNLPLARTLFTQPEFMEAARSYSEMAGLLADLRSASEGDGPGIERRLDDLQQEADSTYPQAKVELMAVRYYLRHVTWV
jgi:hypothetical protein